MRAGLPTILLLVLIAGAVGFVGWWGAAAAPPLQTEAAVPASTEPGSGAGVIAVMTANVRIAETTDGVNAWPNRREFLVKTLLKYSPELVGCQEVTPAQGAYLVKELGKWYDHYPRAGVGKIEGDGSAGEKLLGAVNETFAALNTLFYKKDCFEIVDGEAGLVLPEQLQGDATENTFYTLAVLKEKPPPQESRSKNQETFIVVDTHLRHREAFALKCAGKIREKIGGMLGKYPGAKVVVMGDMNHDRNSRIYAALVGSAKAEDGVGELADCFDYAKKGAESWGNWHAFTGVARGTLPTDLIFSGAGLTAKETRIIRDKDANGHYPSDHFFVLTELVGK